MIIGFILGVVVASVAWYLVYRNNKIKMDKYIAGLNKVVGKAIEKVK